MRASESGGTHAALHAEKTRDVGIWVANSTTTKKIFSPPICCNRLVFVVQKRVLSVQAQLPYLQQMPLEHLFCAFQVLWARLPHKSMPRSTADSRGECKYMQVKHASERAALVPKCLDFFAADDKVVTAGGWEFARLELSTG